MTFDRIDPDDLSELAAAALDDGLVVAMYGGDTLCVSSSCAGRVWVATPTAEQVARLLIALGWRPVIDDGKPGWLCRRCVACN